MTKKQLTPDILVDLKLYPKSEGGKILPIKNDYGCPAKIGSDFFDCRIYIENEIELGPSKGKVAIKFLSPELVKPLLKKGDKFFLWESRIFGEAVVTDVLF